VEIREPRLVLVFKNPLSVVYVPPLAPPLQADEGGEVIGPHNQIVPASNPVNVSWFVDGAKLVASQRPDEPRVSLDYSSSGNHTVRAFVENGDFFLNGSWAVAAAT